MLKEKKEPNSSYATERKAAEHLVKNYLLTKNNENHLETIYLYSNFTCNEKCQYCWINSVNTDHKTILTKKFVQSFLDDAMKMGLKRVKISGGEPLLNDALPEIINSFLKNGIFVEVESNGTLITEAFVQSLLTENLEQLYFKISLDSADSNVQKDITGYSFAFDETIRGINILKKHNICFDIITVANKINIVQMQELIEFVSLLNPNKHRIILNIQPIGHGLENKALNIDMDDMDKLMDYIYSEYSSKVEFGTLHSTLPPAFVPVDQLKLNFCSWGNGMCGIMPNGDVSICAPAFETMGIVAGNLKSMTLEKIWKSSSLFKNLREIGNLEGVCGKCVYRMACRGMCRIFAKAKYGKITSPYPFCQDMYEKGLFPEYCIEEIN